jgi:hypothetical protein
MMLQNDLPSSTQFQSDSFISQCYESLKAVWPPPLLHLLSSESSAAIAHQYYKDSIDRVLQHGDVRLLIIAESHARTNDSIVGAEIKDNLPGLEDYHHHCGHLNLIHALSYGETQLLKGDQKHERAAQTGTLQFWRFFLALSGQLDIKENGEDPLENTTVKLACQAISAKDPVIRIKNKLKVEQLLRERGIVLVDLSPIAFYLSSGTIKRMNQTTGNFYTDRVKSLSSSTYKIISRKAFDHYIRPLFEYAKPKTVLMLGKGMATRLGKERTCLFGSDFDVMTHPSANQHQSEKMMDFLISIRNYVGEILSDQVPSHRLKLAFEQDKTKHLAIGTRILRTAGRKKAKQSEQRATKVEASSAPKTNKRVQPAKTKSLWAMWQQRKKYLVAHLERATNVPEVNSALETAN